MKKSVVLIRTHLLQNELLAVARSIAEAGEYEVVFAVDERQGVIDTAGLPKLALSQADYQLRGLLTDLDDLFWRCGDYPLYVARDAFPDADMIWQFEYDVVFNFDNVVDFFRSVDNASTHDLVVPHLREPEDFWFYKNAMEGRYDTLYRCYFPLVRLSARAIDFLYSKRVEDSRRMSAVQRDDRPDWPNDEAFVATELVNNGFDCSDLSSVLPCYTYETFWSDVLKHPSELPAPDGLVYHAVRSGASYSRLLAATPWLRPRPTPSMLWEFLGLDGVNDPSALSAFRGELQRLLDRVGDDASALFGPGSEVAGLMRVSRAAPIVVEALIAQLVDARMCYSLDWLRRNPEFLGSASGSGLDNLALGMPAWQSSVCQFSSVQTPRGDAEGGNDGRHDVVWGFHTGWEAEGFWAVDLLRTQDVGEVRIYNRREHWERLAGFVIEISDDAATWTRLYTNDPQKLPVGPETDVSLRIGLNARGRFVRVATGRRECLHLREVEVYGTANSQRR